jgi:Tfp pilus assembly protein PilN
MISINMISARRAEHLRMLRWVRALGLSATVVGGGMVAVNAFVRCQIFATGAALGAVEHDLARLKPALDRLAQVQQARESLKPKLMILSKAQGDTTKWYDVLVSLRRTVPRRAWLTSLNVEGGREENQTVRLNGITDSQSTVGETMLRLNATKLYQAVDLHFTQAGKMGERDTVEFEVAAHLPPVEKPKDEGKETKVDG